MPLSREYFTFEHFRAATTRREPAGEGVKRIKHGKGEGRGDQVTIVDNIVRNSDVMKVCCVVTVKRSTAIYYAAFRAMLMHISVFCSCFAGTSCGNASESGDRH